MKKFLVVFFALCCFATNCLASSASFAASTPEPTLEYLFVYDFAFLIQDDLQAPLEIEMKKLYSDTDVGLIAFVHEFGASPDTQTISDVLRSSVYAPPNCVIYSIDMYDRMHWLTPYGDLLESLNIESTEYDAIITAAGEKLAQEDYAGAIRTAADQLRALLAAHGVK